MTLEEWAASNRVRVRKAEDGERIVPGRRGHVYDNGGGELRAMFTLGARHRPRLWGSVRRKLEAAGCRIVQDLDGEGTIAFLGSDPLSSRAVRAAISIRTLRPDSGVPKPFGAPKCPARGRAA